MSKCKGCPFWKWVKADKLYQAPGYHFCEKGEHRLLCKRRKEKSGAEQRALEAYPQQNDKFYEVIRDCYMEGYEQAEKDLGWISVKDRLPDTTEYVFTCVEMNGIPQCVGFHYYKDGKWWEGYEEDSVGAIEYWMEIPKLKIRNEQH